MERVLRTVSLRGRSFYTSLGHLSKTWRIRSSHGLGLNLLVFQLEF